VSDGTRFPYSAILSSEVDDCGTTIRSANSSRPQRSSLIYDTEPNQPDEAKGPTLQELGAEFNHNPLNPSETVCRDR
jgi:hypothetical protein